MSKNAVSGLKPELLWTQFYDMSQIPRPSKKEEKIREHTRNFAKENNLDFVEDKVGNIVIKVPATPGHENAPTIILQGHVDMVCEKNRGTEHDFDNDPIKLIKDGEWITAEGTTLGADNGIGVAAGMAIALDDTSVHGPLELLCTVDEETGLTGANNLEPGFVDGKILLNLDSEEDGAFYIGCSGGQDTMGVFDIKTKKAKDSLVAYELMISGLKGGHSGLDVTNGRANAVRLLAQLLKRIEKYNLQIIEINGGSKRNAIPREAMVLAFIDEQNINNIKTEIDQFVKDTLLEFAINDGGLKITIEKKDGKFSKVFKNKFFKKILNALLALPHGVSSMSPEIPGLVETSTNLATIFTEGDKIRLGTSQRSAIESAKINISNSVVSILELAGASEILTGDGYPGWQPNMNSNILKTAKSVFEELYGKTPEIKAIHAGLECGILGSKYPGLDMISFGPTIQGAHSPDERVNIKDVEKFYDLLKGMLQKLS